MTKEQRQTAKQENEEQRRLMPDAWLGLYGNSKSDLHLRLVRGHTSLEVLAPDTRVTEDSLGYVNITNLMELSTFIQALIGRYNWLVRATNACAQGGLGKPEKLVPIPPADL